MQMAERDRVVVQEEARPMSPNGWQWVTLGDVVSIHAEQVNPALQPGKLFCHFSIPAFDENYAPVKELGADIGSKKFAVPADSILVSRLNPRLTRVWEPTVENGDFAIASTEFVVLRPRGLDRRFLKYLCLSPKMRSELEGMATGTSGSHQRVRPRDVLNIRILLPPLPEQRAIAHVLGTLDDKIELNRRAIETLEEIARALFRSWFVDFDPVRAKMGGRWRRGESLPGLPTDLFDLFPDRLVDSELGEIPEGWEVRQFGDIATWFRDNENPAMSPDSVFSHFSIPAFDERQTPKRELGGSIKSVKSRVPQGTVLISKLNPEIKRVWLVDVSANERAICSTEFLVLRPRPPFQSSYVYCLALSTIFRQQIESLVTGTSRSHQRAPANAVLSLEAVIPNTQVVAAFEKSVSRQLIRSKALRRESRVLAEQRDALLPEMVSGELKLKRF